MKYPLGIQTFSKIIEGNMLYVDKTEIIYQLLQQGSVYFLSRPRRFGKSLLISTLEALLSGQKPLFQGLAIADTDYDFATYPVLTIEFSREEYNSADNLRGFINNVIDHFAEQYQISLDGATYALRLDEFVTKLHHKTGMQVVLLIDEYDKPILNNLKKPQLDEIKEVIGTFYAVIKSLDKHLRFVFITGVSKFSKVSVFSGMNSLTDISMHRQFANICGITQSELERYLSTSVGDLAQTLAQQKSTLMAEIKHWYNGYYFHPAAQSVYNPYSLLSLFEYQEFQNYWFTTATPTFLLNLLRDSVLDLKQLSSVEVGVSVFAASEPENMNVLSLLVQTGYLTIKKFADRLYTLDFPNYEVKSSFYESITTRYGNLETGMGEGYINKLLKSLNAGDIPAFLDTMAIFFANIPYDIAIQQEKYYQTLFYAIFTLIGLNAEVEVSTNVGRIDCVVTTSSRTYIIEFKLNGTKEDAIQQILENKYAEKYKNSGNKVVLLGIEFDRTTRNIGGYIEQPL